MLARVSDLDWAFPADKVRRSLQVRVWVRVCLICIPLLSLLPTDYVLGGDWTTTASLTVREVYTDNIGLAPPGEEKSDFVTDINPGLAVRGRGARLDANFVYSPQAIIRARDNSTDVSHRLQADATTELVEQRFFLDLRSTVAQTNLTNTGRQAEDNIFRTGNRVDTFTYSVSPHLRQRFGSFAEALVRYTFDEVINEGDAVDSRSNKIDVRISSGSRFTRLLWSTGYNHQRVENRDAGNEEDTRSEQFDGTLRFLMHRKFSVFVSGGVENNDFESLSDNDGSFWRAGATWTPSRRTSFEASYGERFSGESLAVSLRHRSRRSILTASFDEDTTTTREIQLERVLFVFVDPFGNPIVNPLTGGLILVPIDIPTLTDEVIVRQRFQGSITFQGRRTTVNLGGFHDERDFQRSGDKETVRGAKATLSRELSSRTSLSLSTAWQATDFRDAVREDTRWDAAIGLRYKIGPSLNTSLQYARQEQDSNIEANDFIENRVTLAMSMTF